nr:RloB family protein [Bacteroides finegoldii]
MAATKGKNINPRVERKITRISGVREVKQTFQAINHAKTIMKQFDGNNPAQQESSTTVYLLVEELNKFL